MSNVIEQLTPNPVNHEHGENGCCPDPRAWEMEMMHQVWAAGLHDAANCFQDALKAKWELESQKQAKPKTNGKYGKLDENWPKMLHDGFRECMRVLKPDGVLIFKWSENQIPANDLWKAIGEKPLFGHHSGKKSQTFWGCFMKLENSQ